MAYNRKNLLQRVIEIQNIVIAAQHKGVSQKFVFENEVAPRFHISYATFNNYLAINAKLEMESIKKKEADKRRQLSIEF